MLGSLGTAGVPGTTIVMLTLTLSTAGLPLEGIGYIVAIDRIIDMMRTATNVTGQMLVPVLVAKEEGILNQGIYDGRRRLAARRPGRGHARSHAGGGHLTACLAPGDRAMSPPPRSDRGPRWMLSSAGEHLVHTEGVAGSIPAASTITSSIHSLRLAPEPKSGHGG